MITDTELMEIVESTYSDCFDTLSTKGADYASKTDRLANFKLISLLIKATTGEDVSPKLVWLIYFAKHMIPVIRFAVGTQLESEPIQGRIKDAINYLFLLAAFVAEQEKDSSKSEASAAEQQAQASEIILDDDQARYFLKLIGVVG